MSLYTHTKDYSSADSSAYMMAEGSDFGQVFTPPDVADFMVKLIVDEIKNGDKILDPCIGKNIFYDKLKHATNGFHFTGVEIDSGLLNEEIREIYKNEKNYLFEGNFFDYSDENQYDYAILNPPYIRQERIRNKKKILETLSSSQRVAKKSNLFVYFILKTINHLKKNGKFVAIIYDSWLYADFGTSFRQALDSDGCVEEIHHFEKEVFPDALVGATILLFSKQKQKRQTKYFRYARFGDINSLNQPEKIDLLQFNFSKQETYLNDDLFVRINDLCSGDITRGIETPHNPSFYGLPRDISSIDIMKNTKKITGMKVKEEFLEKVLHVPDIDNADDVTIGYLKEVKSGLPGQSNVKTLSNLVEKQKDWYKLKIQPPSDIIFSYYLRDNIKFVSNENHYNVSNNFYLMKILRHFYAQFAILNSSITIQSIKNAAKPQGNGLLKIQLNKFKEVKVIDADLISENSRESLSVMGNKLVNAETDKSIKKIREEIDEIILEIIG